MTRYEFHSKQEVFNLHCPEHDRKRIKQMIEKSMEHHKQTIVATVELVWKINEVDLLTQSGNKRKQFWGNIYFFRALWTNLSSFRSMFEPFKAETNLKTRFFKKIKWSTKCESAGTSWRNITRWWLCCKKSLRSFRKIFYR